MKLNVDLHTHTIACDHAYSTLGEYIRCAPSRNIVMFATTDHGPKATDSPHPWHFNNLRVVPRICEGVAVLRGAEANILEDGSIDLEENQLKILDIVLAGMHGLFLTDNKDVNTSAYLKVIKSGLVDVIAHPGALYSPFHHEEMLLAAKEHNVAIEINSSSDVNSRMGSTDNCIEIATLAKKIGNRISVGSDSHICYYLGNFDHSYMILEKAGITEEQIINRTPNSVLDFLESRGHAPITELREFFKNSD
ncbi:MAG: PHP domain-containing protein [Succinivibrio sp.]